MTTYILIIGPMDQLFIGPFADMPAAEQYAEIDKLSRPEFAYYFMSEVEMQANVEEFGEIEIESPS